MKILPRAVIGVVGEGTMDDDEDGVKYTRPPTSTSSSARRSSRRRRPRPPLPSKPNDLFTKAAAGFEFQLQQQQQQNAREGYDYT